MGERASACEGLTEPTLATITEVVGLSVNSAWTLCGFSGPPHLCLHGYTNEFPGNIRALLAQERTDSPGLIVGTSLIKYNGNERCQNGITSLQQWLRALTNTGIG